MDEAMEMHYTSFLNVKEMVELRNGYNNFLLLRKKFVTSKPVGPKGLTMWPKITY